MTSPPSWRRLAVAGPAACAVLTACFIGATLIAGWWGVPVMGVVWGVWSRKNVRPPVAAGLSAAVCAVVAWAALLMWTAAVGPLPLLVRTLGAVVGVPGLVLLALALVFAGLLAWSATTAARP
jgi:hypothetical protein